MWATYIKINRKHKCIIVHSSDDIYLCLKLESPDDIMMMMLMTWGQCPVSADSPQWITGVQARQARLVVAFLKCDDYRPVPASPGCPGVLHWAHHRIRHHTNNTEERAPVLGNLQIQDIEYFEEYFESIGRCNKHYRILVCCSDRETDM